MMFSRQGPPGGAGEPSRGLLKYLSWVVCRSARMQDKQVESAFVFFFFSPSKKPLSFLLLSWTLLGLSFPDSESELL